MDTDDLEPRAKAADTLHINLDDFSVDDLNLRIEDLNAEIVRCQNAIEERQSTRDSAESVFR